MKGLDLLVNLVDDCDRPSVFGKVGLLQLRVNRCNLGLSEVFLDEAISFYLGQELFELAGFCFALD